MPKYVDGYVLPVPADKIDAYRKIASAAAKVFKEHGAIDYVECVADDMEPPFGRPFPKAVNAKPNETVVFAWIVFKSRAHRDKVQAKVMKDPRMEAICGENGGVPFNPKRMSWGGFKVIVQG